MNHSKSSFIFSVIAVLFSIFAIISNAEAREYYHHHEHNYNPVPEKTIIKKYSGAALGMAASSCNFKTASQSVQGCFGAADVDDTGAGVFGIGFRTDAGKNPLIFNFKYGIEPENDVEGISGGINWNF